MPSFLCLSAASAGVLVALGTPPSNPLLMLAPTPRDRLRRTAEHLLGPAAPNRPPVSALGCASTSSTAAGGDVAAYRRALHLLSDEMVAAGAAAEISPRWIGETARFHYLNRRPNGKEFILVDAGVTPPQRRPAFDHQRLATALAELRGEEVSASALPFNSITLSADLKQLKFNTGGCGYTCHLGTASLTLEATDVTETGGPDALPRTDVPSPDGALTAFVQNHNLWLRNVATGQTMQLSHDGEQGYEYATPLLSKITDAASHPFTPAVFTPRLSWSKDSRFIVTTALDFRNVPHLTMVESTPADQFRPKYHDYIYPLPGDYKIPTATPVVFEVAKLRQVTVQTKPVELLYGGGSGPGFSWTPEGKLRYRSSERGYKRVYMEESESSCMQPLQMPRHMQVHRADQSYNCLLAGGQSIRRLATRRPSSRKWLVRHRQGTRRLSTVTGWSAIARLMGANRYMRVSALFPSQ